MTKKPTIFQLQILVIHTVAPKNISGHSDKVAITVIHVTCTGSCDVHSTVLRWVIAVTAVKAMKAENSVGKAIFLFPVILCLSFNMRTHHLPDANKSSSVWLWSPPRKEEANSHQWRKRDFTLTICIPNKEILLSPTEPASTVIWCSTITISLLLL